jgi:hypothetical protein
MVPDVLLTEKFGDVRMTEAFRKINDEYAALIDAAKSRRSGPGWKRSGRASSPTSRRSATASAAPMRSRPRADAQRRARAERHQELQRPDLDGLGRAVVAAGHGRRR